MINWHNTYVHCWIWKILIKLWVNMLQFFFVDQVIICIFIEFFLLKLSIFHVLFLCINKVSIFVGIFRMVYMVIWFIKVYWVNFWTRAINCSLRRNCVFGWIFIFIEFLWSWYIFYCSELLVLWVPLHVFAMVFWRENSLLFYHIALAFSHTFVDKSESNKVFFQLWDWWFPGYLKGYGLILLTSIPVLIPLTSVSVLILLYSISVLVLLTGVFLGVLTLMWSILMLEFISRMHVDNGLNRWMGWIHVYVFYLFSFRYFYHLGGDCEGSLVTLWLPFKPSVL